MTPAEVVQAWYQTQRTDPQLANERYLADNVKVLLPRSRAIVGKAAATAHFVKVANSFKKGSFPASNTQYVVMISEGNKVARRHRWRAETNDGQIIDIFVFNLHVVENGKITHFEEHFDTLERSKFTYAYDPAALREGYNPEDWLL
jgi:hypothetical protein